MAGVTSIEVKESLEQLTQQFEQWVNSRLILEPGEWIAIDGKSIKGTVTEHRTADQNAR